MLSRAKKEYHVTTEQILEMFRPLLIKNSLINGRFDEDLYQELIIEVLKCIQLYQGLD
ncbi:MAG: helix-turn-helix domain-containing protein [Lachnospiraceae bacterium]